MVPQNTVKVTGKDAEQLLKLMEALEEHDDVQNVYSNFDIEEKELASIQGTT
jgi:transcriptional/translational regulatory protein YebC/TACO1